jgi:hypothetical protein
VSRALTALRLPMAGSRVPEIRFWRRLSSVKDDIPPRTPLSSRDTWFPWRLRRTREPQRAKPTGRISILLSFGEVKRQDKAGRQEFFGFKNDCNSGHCTYSGGEGGKRGVGGRRARRKKQIMR